MQRQVYTLAFYLLLPIYFVRLFLKGINNKEYLSRWPERLGIAKNTPSEEKNLIWVHAVSVGEVNASIPLLRKLKKSTLSTGLKSDLTKAIASLIEK